MIYLVEGKVQGQKFVVGGNGIEEFFLLFDVGLVSVYGYVYGISLFGLFEKLMVENVVLVLVFCFVKIFVCLGNQVQGELFWLGIQVIDVKGYGDEFVSGGMVMGNFQYCQRGLYLFSNLLGSFIGYLG